MSNLHSEQKGNQVHKPKKFEDAGATSILYKDANGRVGYIHRDISHSSVITTVDASYGNLHNTYLKLYKFNNKCITALYFQVAGQTAEWTKPTDCDDSYNINIESDATATEIATAIKNWFDSNSDYGTATTSTADVTVVYANRSVIDVSNSLFSLTNTPTNPSNDSILISDQSDSGQLKFQELNETVQDIVGNMFTGNTETNITATYQDSDGTIDLVATGGASGNAFTTINCPSGTDPVADSSSDTLNLVAGTGITISGNSTTDSITITNTASSTDTNTQIIGQTYRFETQNLVTDSSKYYGYNAGYHNKDGKIEVDLGTSMTNLSANYSIWSSLYIRPYGAEDDANTYVFANCNSLMVGTSGATVNLEIYKYSPCGLESNFGTATRVAYSAHSLEGNTASKCVNWTLESEANRTLASRDVLVVALSTTEGLEDLDCRGIFSYEINKT